MKFYYNNKLIRTSKTRHYKYAIMYQGKSRCLSETRINAEKSRQREYNQLVDIYNSNIHYAKVQGIDAINRYAKQFENGKQYSSVDEYIKYMQQLIKELTTELIIVPVEEK